MIKVTKNNGLPLQEWYIWTSEMEYSVKNMLNRGITRPIFNLWLAAQVHKVHKFWQVSPAPYSVIVWPSITIEWKT